MNIMGDRFKRPWGRRLIGALVIAAVCAASLGAAQPTGADTNTAAENTPDPSAGAADAGADQYDRSGVEIVRYFNADPYAQSLTLAQALVDAGDGTSEWVVLASGESWANAATAGPLAASLGAPVVLVPPSGLQTANARPDLVEFLRSTGARRVVIVGDPDVMPNHEPSVLFGLGMLPRNIERIHGGDPIGTSIAVAERIDIPAELGETGRTVIIASDRSVADAVAVGPLAASGPFPLLLTSPDELDPRIAAYLTTHEVEHVVLAGGASALPPEVQEEIETAGATVTRLAGRDRIDTARLTANLLERHTSAIPACNEGPTRIGLAPGQHPERAMAAGPLLAARCIPLRYAQSDRLPVDLRNTLYLSRDRPHGTYMTVFGDEDFIPASTLEIDTPPVRFAAFNFRLSADTDALIGVLEVIDETGIRQSFPETEIVLSEKRRIPLDWWQRPHDFIVYRLGPEISWSPKGDRLAYRRLDTGELYSLDLRNGELRRIALVDPGLNEFRSILKWSPDGSRLAFDAVVKEELTLSDPKLTVNGISEYTSELFLHDVNSGKTERLTHNNVFDDIGPWSPDGTRLLYQQTPASRTWVGSPRPAYQHLNVLDPATGESSLLHPYVLYAAGPYMESALWSPDGKSLTFVAIPESNPWERSPHAYLADPDGSRVHEYPNPRCDDCIPYPTGRLLLPRIYMHGWSPSGDRIAYSAFFESQDKWLVRDTATGDVVEVLREDFDPQVGPLKPYRFIGWTRDGAKLLLLQNECHDGDLSERAVWRIVQVPADGAGSSEELKLSWPANADPPFCYPTFRLGPDGQTMVIHQGKVVADREAGFALIRLDNGTISRLLRPSHRAPDAAFRVPGDCNIEWTATGVQIGCSFSIGQF